MSFRAWALLAFLSFLWGGSFFSSKIAVVAITPMTLVAIRVGLAAAALHVVLWARGERMPLDRQSLIDFAGMGISNNVVPFALIFYGAQSIPSGLIAILNASTPVSTVLIAHLFTRDDRLTPLRTLGVILGLVGVTVVIGPGVLGQAGDHILAELAILGASLSYGISALWSRRFRGRPPLVSAAGQLTLSTVMTVPLALMFDHPWTLQAPSMTIIWSVLFLALMATSLAYVVFFEIITIAGASNATLVTFLVPVSAIVLGTLFLGEHLELRHYAGMALLIIGLSAIDGRIWRRSGVTRVP